MERCPALQLVPPFLAKTVIDGYIPARDLSGLGTIAALYLATLLGTPVSDRTLAELSLQGLTGLLFIDLEQLKPGARVIGVVRNPDRVPSLLRKGIAMRKADLVRAIEPKRGR